MAKFFVGQRVRLVRAEDPRNMGIEGRIVHFEYAATGHICGDGQRLYMDCNCGVHYDGDGHPCWEHTSRLEPILPEGMQPVAWEDCLWQPEGVAA